MCGSETKERSRGQNKEGSRKKKKKKKILVEDTERSQIAESKHKKIIPGDKREYQPSKKTKEKQPARYHRNAGVKIGGTNLYERCVCAGQDCLVHNSM